jgi:hypothetical protein
VWLQIEPGAANVEALIDAILTRYKKHPCVVGFGIDVEWLDQQIDSYGRPVTDAEALAWEKRVRGYDSTYTLFLKHFMKNRMPKTYRGNILFIDDSQQFTGFNNCISDFKAWGQAFAPSKVGFQFGYPDDRFWWSTLSNPPQAVGNALLASVSNTAVLIWVDFTITEVFPLATTSVRGSTFLPEQLNLAQNYPNPFNPSTTISFSLPTKSHVTLKVFDVMGREVSTIVSDVLPAGAYQRTWNAAGASSGVYFYRLQAGAYTETKRLVLLR